MSDRIDELVAAIDANTLLQWDGKDVALMAAHDLAAIAREAEANAKGQEANAVFALQLKREAEADAAEWIDRCYQSEERALKAEAMCEWLAGEVAMGRHDTVDNVLDAAREAVQNER